MMRGVSLRLLVGISLLGFGALTQVGGSGSDSQATRSAAKPTPRQPVALVLADQGKWLFVANRRSGTIAVIDVRRLRALDETVIGECLADLAATPDDRFLLAVDETAHQLVLLGRRETALEVVQRLPVAPFPVSAVINGEGSRAAVASLWSRSVTLVDLEEARGKATGKPALRVAKTLRLPFAPRRQLLVRNGAKLVVADAFGGRLAVLDFERAQVESIRALPAHNIRGLALSADGKDLLVAHQVLNPLGETTRDDIHWGNVITNNLRFLPLSHVATPGADLLAGSRLVQLGEVGHGAADPAAVAVAPTGTTVVALAGIGEVAIGPDKEGGWRRLKVGRRPTALALSPHRSRAYVANTFEDSVTIVDLLDPRSSTLASAAPKILAEVPLGARAVSSEVERGEHLFYDARLSHDGWFSCHSCHTDGHTNGLLNDNLGDGSFGAPKRVLSLLGVKDTAPWAWNGSMTRLEDQVRKSILTTMHGSEPADDQVRALGAFLRTFSPPPPPMPSADRAAVRRGEEVFHRQGCGGCHAPPTYTSRKTYDVGLADEVGNTQFNPPSLRGVSQGGPFFHDNRAATMEEVFERYRHQLKSDLTKQDANDLLSFLRSL
jgi:DNA-binding beta-propeller fold protein YncE